VNLPAMSVDLPYGLLGKCLPNWGLPTLPAKASSIRLAISTRSLGVKSLRMLFSA
jgi:hypothetical protein